MNAKQRSWMARVLRPEQELTAEQRAMLEAVPVLSADSVRRFVATTWPQAMQSPLAQAMHGASALTPEQITAGREDWLVDPTNAESSAFYRGVRFAERHFGIQAAK